MKKILFFVFIFGGIVLLSSYRLMLHVNENVLSTLGLSKTDADNYILGSVTSGSGYLFKPVNMARLVTMSGSDRAALTQNVCVYIKNYCHSGEFKSRYEAYRQSRRPHVRKLDESEKSIQKEMIAQQEAMATPEMLAMLPPEARENFIKSLNEMKAALNGEMTAEQKAQWEEEVPADPNVAIKRGLKTFLEESRNVDYNATTGMKNSKKVFTNPVYEAKPGMWKACYRAGKDVGETGRKFAMEWLAELK